MATRRARIQIKPNTGPRNVGRDAGTEKTPATPPKGPAQSPTKTPAQSPTKTPAQPPTKAVVQSPTKPPPPAAPSPTPPPALPRPLRKISPKIAPAPVLPTLPSKPLATSPTKAPAATSPTKTVTALPVLLDTPQVSSSETEEISEETTLAVAVFKKPDVPKKNNQLLKELSLVPLVVESSSSQHLTTKKNPTRKRKPRDGEVKRHTPKHLSAFKQTEPPDRTKMTIMDLIHWNPIQNPMKKSNEIVRTSSTQSLVELPAIENTSPEKVDKQNEESEEFVPGPRVIVGEDGQITLDESSLVIEQTAPQNDLSQEVVYETSDTTYSSYSKKIISRQFWTMKETAMFYKALSVVGTDFALMAKFFPKRTRADLKRKFKKEERTRRDLLDKAVSEWHKFDLEDIQDFLFCKEARPLDNQEEEEARLDNPDEPGEGPHPNNYVRENLINRQPKKRGRPPGQGNKSKNEKATDAQNKKNKKTNKRPPARNAWSDEEAEPVGSEEEINLCDDNEEQDKCEEHQNETCDCCQIKTKTSKRQQSLEAKKRKLQEQEEQRMKYLEAGLPPVREFVPSPSPKRLEDTVSFTVLSNKSVLKTPVPVASVSPVFRTPSTPSDASLSPIQRTPMNVTPSTSTFNGTAPNAATANSNKNTPSSVNKVTGIPLPGRTVLTPKPVNLVNVNSPVAASPLLQALLNRVPQNTPSGTPSQFLLVADKTPNNEQVLHVYLVSPNPTQGSPTSSNAPTANGVQVNAETLRRLGIRPIAQQQQQQQSESQKTQDVSESKT